MNDPALSFVRPAVNEMRRRIEMTFRELLPIIVPLLVLDLILVSIALVDLYRREPERVRGPKWVWALVSIFIATFGAISYLVIGRKD
jgi:hypothetical protein